MDQKVNKFIIITWKINNKRLLGKEGVPITIAYQQQIARNVVAFARSVKS